MEKKRAYEQRITEVEHASFTPIVLSASGGLAKGATKDLPQCSQRSETSLTVQLSAGSDVPSPSVCYDLLYNVYAVHVRRREGQLEQYPS